MSSFSSLFTLQYVSTRQARKICCRGSRGTSTPPPDMIGFLSLAVVFFLRSLPVISQGLSNIAGIPDCAVRTFDGYVGVGHPLIQPPNRRGHVSTSLRTNHQASVAATMTKSVSVKLYRALAMPSSIARNTPVRRGLIHQPSSHVVMSTVHVSFDCKLRFYLGSAKVWVQL